MVGGTSAVVCADTGSEDFGTESVEGVEVVYRDFEGAVLFTK